ncbi:hypothetical protein [Streptomyces sp. C]|uniref:hypothetical protein n=1 Tax=Streptomyces sp. C TaxID=253839 RepID=UPI0001B541BE|nr:hypothetical protein [Streptomyces sp. C]EFL14781.1 predicted protein [Streptomyces sp. C]
MKMRRRIVGAVVAGAAGLTLGLLPAANASAHDGGWDSRSDYRHSNHWDDDDCGGNGRWSDHDHGWNDSDWGRWDNADWHDHGGWNDDWGGWR